MDQAHIPKVALRWAPHGKRKPGPKATWCQTVIAELSKVKLTRVEIPHVIQNREKWRGTPLPPLPYVPQGTESKLNED